MSQRIDEKRLAEIEARLGKTTEGPWMQATHVGEPRAIASAAQPDASLLGLDKDGMAIVWREADAAFIAHAHSDVLDLVADLRAALERIDVALDIIGESGCDCDEEGCDAETTCEEAGHEPCLAHRIERALTGGGS